MKTLVLVRGVPGAGKSTLAGIMAPHANVAADDYFDLFRNGKFDTRLLPAAHKWCQARASWLMCSEAPAVAVHNTFTQEWEMRPYFQLAEKYGYRVTTIVVENRHGSTSVHNVPCEVVDKMKNRFDIKL